MSNFSSPPKRLRHTPSLPNIRPSGSPEMQNTACPRPSAPPSPRPTLSSAHSSNAVLGNAPTETRPTHVKYPSADPTYSKTPISLANLSKMAHRRRRTDQPHLQTLLTPPLTPSSSINTDSSRDTHLEVDFHNPVGVAALKDGQPHATSEEIIDDDPLASRILLFVGIRKTLSPQALEAAVREALTSAATKYGTTLSVAQSNGKEPVTKGMNTRDLAKDGRVPVIFFDLNVAKTIDRYLKEEGNSLSEALGDKNPHGVKPLQASMVSVDDLLKTFGASPLLSSAAGNFILRLDPISSTADDEDLVSSLRRTKGASIRAFLKSFGTIRSFRFESREFINEIPSLVYSVEFHDSRHSEQAYEALRAGDKVIAGIKLSVFGREEHRSVAPPVDVVQFPNISTGRDLESPPPTEIYATHNVEEHDAGPAQPASPVYFAHAAPDCLYCPSKSPSTSYHFHCPLSPVMSGPLFHHPTMPMQQVFLPTPPLSQAMPALAEYPQPATWFPRMDPAVTAVSPSPVGVLPMPFNAFQFIPPPPTDYTPTSSAHGHTPSPPPHSYNSLNPLIQDIFRQTNEHGSAYFGTPNSSTSQLGTHVDAPSYPPPDLHTRSTGMSDRNTLNIMRIEEGSDTRTTVMIKNIPNKMSDSDLTEYINRVCPRRLDFLYLRMDFSNGCNVGYAFVNFITVQDLLNFAKKKLGVKWNMFQSEKVLQMSYANYQGKEALVEKFKNSAIMDEKEAWRPRIFYSSGPNQGLPEPFPAPTHLRRKERSSHNRGALFVPGIGDKLRTHGPLHRRYDQEGLKMSSPHGSR